MKRMKEWSAWLLSRIRFRQLIFSIFLASILGSLLFLKNFSLVISFLGGIWCFVVWISLFLTLNILEKIQMRCRKIEDNCHTLSIQLNKLLLRHYLLCAYRAGFNHGFATALQQKRQQESIQQNHNNGPIGLLPS